MRDIAYCINVATARTVEDLLAKKSFVEAARIASLNMSGDDRAVMLRRIIVAVANHDYDLSTCLNKEYRAEQGMWYGEFPPTSNEVCETSSEFEVEPKTIKTSCPAFAA